MSLELSPLLFVGKYVLVRVVSSKLPRIDIAWCLGEFSNCQFMSLVKFSCINALLVAKRGPTPKKKDSKSKVKNKGLADVYCPGPRGP